MLESKVFMDGIPAVLAVVKQCFEWKMQSPFDDLMACS